MEGQEYPRNREDVQIERLDKLGLINKEIEPDKGISGTGLNRNFQLGNLGGPEFKQVMALVDLEVSLKAIPTSKGGWLTHDLAKDIFLTKADKILVTSNSKTGQGQLRRLLRTAVQKQYLQQESGRSPAFGGGKN